MGKRKSAAMRKAKKQVREAKQRSPSYVRVEAALDSNPIDVDTITLEARLHGIPAELRCRAWLALLRLDRAQLSAPEEDLKQLVQHEEEDQVQRDVARSMWRWGTCEHEYKARVKYREQLTVVMNTVLCRHRFLHYYQGYHDVATVLLMCTEDTTVACGLLERMSLSYLRDDMQPTLEEVMKQLGLLFPLVRLAAPDIEAKLQECNLAPYFAVSWVLTWYSHDFVDPETLLRLFDFFLASHPLMPLYFGVSLITMRREEILAAAPEFSLLHTMLSKVPKEMTVGEVEGVIQSARRLFDQHPPARLLQVAALDLNPKAMFLTYPYEWMAASDEFFSSGQLEAPPRRPLLGMSNTSLLTAGAVAGVAVLATFWLMRE